MSLRPLLPNASCICFHLCFLPLGLGQASKAPLLASCPIQTDSGYLVIHYRLAALVPRGRGGGALGRPTGCSKKSTLLFLIGFDNPHAASQRCDTRATARPLAQSRHPPFSHQIVRIDTDWHHGLAIHNTGRQFSLLQTRQPGSASASSSALSMLWREKRGGEAQPTPLPPPMSVPSSRDYRTLSKTRLRNKHFLQRSFIVISRCRQPTWSKGLPSTPHTLDPIKVRITASEKTRRKHQRRGS